jgi:uncharacterized protein YkwD
MNKRRKKYMLLRKLSISMLSVAILTGCTQAKPAENKVATQVEASAVMDKAIKEQLEDKYKQEENIKQRAQQEAKLKAEEESEAKAEADVKAQHTAAKPLTKPVQNQPKPLQPASSAPTPHKSSTSSSALKYVVDYKGDIENEILLLVNQERAKIGVKPLVMNEDLRTMARYKSNDMLQYDYFDHTSPTIGGLSSLAKKFGYSYTALGENIWMSKASSAEYLRRNTTAAKIMNGWMNSPGHKGNILNPGFGRIGVGVTLSTDGFSHATQEFSN